MDRGISLDQYFTVKENIKTQVFIFLLGNEYPYLNNETTWINSFNYPVYVIRMSEDDFHQMDFAAHPKIVCTKKGKELFEINGLPSVKFLSYKLNKI